MEKEEFGEGTTYPCCMNDIMGVGGGIHHAQNIVGSNLNLMRIQKKSIVRTITLLR